MKTIWEHMFRDEAFISNHPALAAARQEQLVAKALTRRPLLRELVA